MLHRPLIPLFLLALLLAAPLAAQSTTRLSLDSSGNEGNGISESPAISADGRFVAFTSFANDLVPGDTNSAQDVFVRDLAAGTTTRVSVDSAGNQGLWSSYQPSISADGRFVSFQSDSDTLVPGDTNGYRDTFVHDRLTGLTERVSVDSNGAQANGWGDFSAISAGGVVVAFQSYASDLVAGDGNGQPDIFVRDRAAGTTTRVSVGPAGVEADGPCFDPAVSADGRYVLFESAAGNLVPGDSNAARDLFVHDRLSGVTERVSLRNSGGQANDFCTLGAISADGRHVAFVSWATNLVSGDANGLVDVFVRDRLAQTTELASLGPGGVQGDNDSGQSAPSLSSDGRFVLFDSLAGNLVAGDSNWIEDLFLRDRSSATTTRVSVGAGGSQATGLSGHGALSADGRLAAFHSDAADLVPGDGNLARDVFLRDRGPGTGSLLNTIVLSAPATAPVGSPLTVSWFAAPPGSDFWLARSWRRSGSVLGGHPFDLGQPVSVVATGVHSAEGTAAFTSPPVPAAAAGRTVYLEAAARDAGGQLYDSNATATRFY